MPDAPVLPSEPFPEYVKKAFLSDYGAMPFDSVQDLRERLKILFEYRVQRHLENIAQFDIIQFPDISSCSGYTLEEG